MKTAVAKTPNIAANMDGNDFRTAKACPLPSGTASFFGESSISFMQFKCTSGLDITPVAFPVAANIVIRGVILLTNGSRLSLGKVATLCRS
jgi:hypothetical protein